MIKLFGIKCVFKNYYLQFLDPNYTYMSIFHPLEVVCRDSETQLQVGETVNKDKAAV